MQMRAADLGMSSGQVVRTYAKEASTLLLSEVEKCCIPDSPALHHVASRDVDPHQLSLNAISGGLRSIQTAPTQQQRPSSSRDAWGWLEPGRRRTACSLSCVSANGLHVIQLHMLQ